MTDMMDHNHNHYGTVRIFFGPTTAEQQHIFNVFLGFLCEIKSSCIQFIYQMSLKRTPGLVFLCKAVVFIAVFVCTHTYSTTDRQKH